MTPANHLTYTLGIRYLKLEIKTMADTTVTHWLKRRFENSKVYQAKRGIRFDLSFEDYLSLWSADKLRQLEKYAAKGNIDRRMGHKEKGWVLSWVSKEARKAGVLNKDTARVLTRKTSEMRFFMQKGERHTAAAKKAIGDAHRGKKISEEHRRAISASKKGVKQSEEHKRKRVDNARATRAAKKTQEAQQLPC
jgi:hypothetical protein